MDTDGSGLVYWWGARVHHASERFPARSPHRRVAGDRVDAVRPAGPGRVRRSVRPRRAGRSRVAAPGLGRCAAAGAGASPTDGVHPIRPAGLRGARRRDGRCHAAVHGRRRPAAPGYRERAGVPRAAGRRGRPRAGQDSLAGAGGRRCAAAHRAVARDGRPGRRRVRSCGRDLLGGLHPVDPAGRRRGLGAAGARGLHAGGGNRRHPGGRSVRPRARDTGAAADRARARRAATRRPVQPRAAGPAPPHHRRVRDLDESGTRNRAGRRYGRAAPGPGPIAGGRNRVRRRRRNRCRADRGAGAARPDRGGARTGRRE